MLIVFLFGWTMGIYAAIGVLFALLFITRGVDVIDANARGAGFWFRVLIFPGSAALWPLLLLRWRRKNRIPVERNAHRIAASRS